MVAPYLSAACRIHPFDNGGDVVTVDSIAAMRLQEQSDVYRRVDYLGASAAAAVNDRPVGEFGARTFDADLSSSSSLTYSSSYSENGDVKPSNLLPDANSSAGLVSRSSGRPVDAECRRKMCDWCVKVIDYCNLSRETVSIAMSFLDRFLSLSVGGRPGSANCLRPAHPRAVAVLRCRREYQLASMTALCLAVKVHETLVDMDARHVVGLSRGAYSIEEATKMEWEILTALRWRTSDPTPLAFFSRFLALLPQQMLRNEGNYEDFDETSDDDKTVGSSAEEVLLEMGRTQTEIAAAEYDFVSCKSSVVAAAALLNALDAAGDSLSMTLADREAFIRRVQAASGIIFDGNDVGFVRRRLREMLSGSGGGVVDEDDTGTFCTAATTGTAKTLSECDSRDESPDEEVRSTAHDMNNSSVEANVSPKYRTELASIKNYSQDCIIPNASLGLGHSSLVSACSWVWKLRQCAKHPLLL